MIDPEDFITERGGDPEKIKQSQRVRGASVELVDEVIELWQTARRGEHAVLHHGLGQIFS
jgi:seryl-tRNA synthetase